MGKLALNVCGSIRRFWSKESLPALIELFQANATLQRTVLESREIGGFTRRRKAMRKAGRPDPAILWKAAWPRPTTVLVKATPPAASAHPCDPNRFFKPSRRKRGPKPCPTPKTTPNVITIPTLQPRAPILL